MNERIKQLIEKATIRGEEYLPGNDGHPTPTFYFDKEKFAELIVLECLDMMGTNISGTFNSDWDFDTQVKFVKKHFGIKR